MKRFSEDGFEFKSQLSSAEILNRLNQRTLKKKLLAMEPTDKDFIGVIGESSFEVIDSSFPLPYGAACVIKGNIAENSNIVGTTTLHQWFRVLFIIWLVVMTLLFVSFWIIGSAKLDGLAAFLIGMPICAFLFRLFLHGAYVLARNAGLSKMKRILELVE